MFPFIFMISISFLVIASLTSKLQNDSTNLLISIYSVLGPAQSASIALTATVFILNQHPEIMIKILLIAALAIIFLVNLIGYIIQTPYLLADRKFLKWANRRMRKGDSRSNLIWFHIVSLLSLFTSYKLKMVIFSRLFNFECFKFQLENISKFKVFNVLSFIGYFPEILSLYCCISVLAYSSLTLEELLIFIDLLVIIALNMIFSLIIIRKDDHFFIETTGGLPMNKVFNLVEEMNSSTHMMGRREKETKEKKRVQLDDISQLDQFAYTSTKRDRNPKKKTVQQHKIKEEDSYYFEENDSDVTGSKIHSEISNEELPHEVGNAAPPDEQQQSSKKNTENILNIDDFYEEESAEGVRSLEEQIVNQPIFKQQPLPLQQEEGRLPDGIIEAEYAPCNFQRTRQGITPSDLQHPKDTHTKLSQYLMSFQHNQQQQSLDQQDESKSMDMIEKQSASQQESENHEGKFIALINESALIDSEPSFYPNLLTPHRQEHQKQTTIGKEEQDAAKKIVERVVSAHHSPKKAILVQEEPKALRTNYLSHSIALNQHHDERPIKNKSVEKAKKQESHPINPPIISHPIYGQKGGRSQEEDESDLALSIGKRSKITIKQPTIEAFQEQQSPLEQLQINQGQQSQPDVPRPKFYEQFVHQYESSNPSFKRSYPQSLALFSKNNHKNNSTEMDDSTGNSVPRQPVQAIFTTSEKKDPDSQSSFVLRRNFDQAVKFSSRPRERPMTSKSGRFGKYSLERKVSRGLQGKKMLSLEKIYLQRLTNF